MNIDVRLVAGKFVKLQTGEVSVAPIEFYGWAIGKQWRAVFRTGPKWFYENGRWGSLKSDNDVIELLEEGTE